MDDEKYIHDIENLRDKLHSKVTDKELSPSTILKDDELLELSNQLDELILKYMTEKNN